MIDVARLRRSQSLDIGHFDLIQRSSDFPFPEPAEFFKLQEFGCQIEGLTYQIEGLTYIGLQNVGVIGQAIDNFGGGKAVPTQQTLDIGPRA